MRITRWDCVGLGAEVIDRRWLRTQLRGLGMSSRFTVLELAEALARDRGRPLRLRPEPLPTDGLSGGLLMTRDIDLIAYQVDTSPLHQDHVVCHEFGHLLARHEAITVTGHDAARLLAPHIDPAVVRRMLGRSCSSASDEQQAEWIADLLMAHYITSRTHSREWVVPGTAPAGIRRLVETFGPGIG